MFLKKKNPDSYLPKKLGAMHRSVQLAIEKRNMQGGPDLRVPTYLSLAKSCLAESRLQKKQPVRAACFRKASSDYFFVSALWAEKGERRLVLSWSELCMANAFRADGNLLREKEHLEKALDYAEKSGSKIWNTSSMIAGIRKRLGEVNLNLDKISKNHVGGKVV